jgi:hypothetical protein
LLAACNADSWSDLSAARLFLEEPKLGFLDMWLAFEDKGLIFFAPSNAQAGDIVCQFRYTDTSHLGLAHLPLA